MSDKHRIDLDNLRDARLAVSEVMLQQLVVTMAQLTQDPRLFIETVMGATEQSLARGAERTAKTGEEQANEIAGLAWDHFQTLSEKFIAAVAKPPSGSRN